jgi:AraC-like DNA-binding protein
MLSLRYNYNPINDLLKNLESKYGYHFNKNLNEYYFIKHSLDHVATQQQKTEALLETQNKALSSAVLSRLIKGDKTQLSNAKDILFHSKLDINFDNYGIILFYIESFEGIDSALSTEKNLKILEDYNISQFILDNVANEVISRSAKYIATEVDNIMVYVVNIDAELIETMPNNLIAIAGEIKSFIDKNYDFDITTGVSKVYHDLSTLSDCFYESLEMIEYKHIIGSDSNLLYKDVQNMIEHTDFYYPSQQEHMLIQEIKQYHYENTKQIIEDLFKQNMNTTGSILEIHFCVMLSIISTFIKTVCTMKNVNAIEILDDLEIIKRVQKCNTSSNIKTETLYIAEHIINSIKQIEHSTVIDQDDDLIKTIITFVEQNYALMDLSVAYIADELGLNAVSMSKLFRNTMSESLPDYINKCRIEHAKAIMKSGYNNLEELSVRVGYNNTKTLTRAFKKYVGVPPGKYKEMMD